MALPITITDAGRAEIIAAGNTGTNKVTITAVALGTGRYTPSKGQTALQAEIKRLTSIAGKAVAADTIHVMAQDESSATYNVGEFGLISEKGTLIAVFSQLPAEGWILQKAAPSTLLLATDIVLESLDTAAITFGDISFINPPATTSTPGVVQLVNTLTSNNSARALTAAMGKKLQDEKEPTIEPGTTAQYWRGNKTWRDFATDVRAAVLTGLSTATATAVAATDTVLAALGKLQAQVTGLSTSKLNANANAVSATKLQTARTIGGVAFDGTANINLPGVNAAGNQSTSGNAATATKLATARNIGGVPFDGTVNINLPGVNAAGNQSTSGNAATATKLSTARNINGVPFDGTANITIADATKLPLAGGAITGQIVAANRRAGMYGVYDSNKIDHIWSMGAGYQIAADGSDFGTLYGLAYKHTNNASGGNMAGGHQLVLCSNGTPCAAISFTGNFWTAGSYNGNGAGLTNIPQAGVAGLVAALAAKAALASPALTGTPTAPTPPLAVSNQQLATTEFVSRAVAALVDSSPAALDTLKELATALGNDPNFATTMTSLLALKAPLASPALTGTPTAPTQAAGNNSTRIATTAFVTAVQTLLNAAIALRAPLASPALTGNPTAPTQAAGNNSTRIASTAFVTQAVAAAMPDPTLVMIFNGPVMSNNTTITLTEAWDAYEEIIFEVTANAAGTILGFGEHKLFFTSIIRATDTTSGDADTYNLVTHTGTTRSITVKFRAANRRQIYLNGIRDDDNILRIFGRYKKA